MQEVLTDMVKASGDTAYHARRRARATMNHVGKRKSRPTVHLRFESEELRRDCGSKSRAHRRWGSDIARRIAMRLQQLEAMATVGDLAFLPFDYAEAPNGSIEVAVDESLAVVVRPGSITNEEGATMPTLTVVDIRTASRSARAS